MARVGMTGGMLSAFLCFPPSHLPYRYAYLPTLPSACALCSFYHHWPAVLSCHLEVFFHSCLVHFVVYFTIQVCYCLLGVILDSPWSQFHSLVPTTEEAACLWRPASPASLHLPFYSVLVSTGAHYSFYAFWAYTLHSYGGSPCTLCTFVVTLEAILSFHCIVPLPVTCWCIDAFWCVFVPIYIVWWVGCCCWSYILVPLFVLTLHSLMPVPVLSSGIGT